MTSLANSLLFAIAATFSGIAIAGNDPAPASVRSVAEYRPCRPARVAVFGYLHVSRHGSWISDDPGINGKGLPIRLTDDDSAGRKRLLRYIYRPQENMSNTFSAVFTGITSCNEHGAPVLHVRSVKHIEVRPIRDAGVMPNNSFKPKPLRGSA